MKLIETKPVCTDIGLNGMRNENDDYCNIYSPLHPHDGGTDIEENDRLNHMNWKSRSAKTVFPNVGKI